MEPAVGGVIAMSVQLEFINLIIPIKTIEEKYPGGWEQCLSDYRHSLGGAVWYDDHLFRLGAMSPDGMKFLIDSWEELGFTGYEVEGGESRWVDMCVVEELFSAPTLECDWIIIGDRSATLRGKPPTLPVGRNEMVARTQGEKNDNDI
jgi:hypothetical protein